MMNGTDSIIRISRLSQQAIQVRRTTCVHVCPSELALQLCHLNSLIFLDMQLNDEIFLSCLLFYVYLLDMDTSILV